MNIFSRALLCALPAALIAGCGSAPYYSGRGNDHEVVYRGTGSYEDREVVYVNRPVYYYQPVPAYRVIEVQPAYHPAYRVVPSRIEPETRYYYYVE